MLKPECIICGTEKCNLVRFISSKSGQKFRERLKKGEIDGGHDPDHQWFCRLHLSQANEYSRTYKAKEAILLMKGNV